MAQRNQSRLKTELAVDDALVQSASFEMDADDRQYIDNQIRALQERVIALYDDGVGRLTLLTTNATPARARRYPVAAGEVVSIRAVVSVRSADGSGAVRGEWELKAGYARVSGTLAAEYDPIVLELASTGSPVAPAFALNGNTDVDLMITGIVATDLTWKISEFSL